MSLAVGLEVDVRGAVLDGLGDDRVDELDDRRVVGGLADLGDHARASSLRPPARPRRPRRRGGSCARSAPRCPPREATTGRTSWPVISLRSSSASTFDGSAIATSSDAVVEADRHGVVAAGGLRVEQVERAEVGLVDVQVDVVEAEALGGGARQLLELERAGLDQHLLGGAPVALGLLDAPARRAPRATKPELDDHVGDEAAAPPRRRGGVMPGDVTAALPTRARRRQPLAVELVGQRGEARRCAWLIAGRPRRSCRRVPGVDVALGGGAPACRRGRRPRRAPARHPRPSSGRAAGGQILP